MVQRIQAKGEKACPSEVEVKVHPLCLENTRRRDATRAADPVGPGALTPPERFCMKHPANQPAP